MEEVFCLLRLERLPCPYGLSLGFSKLFLWGLHVLNSIVRSGEEVFCGCGGFRFSVRVIYGAAVFIKSKRSFKCRLVSPNVRYFQEFVTSTLMDVISFQCYHEVENCIEQVAWFLIDFKGRI